MDANDERPRLTVPVAFGLADVPALLDRAERVLQEGTGTRLECDVSQVKEPNLETLEGLARVELAASRRGCVVRLRGASVELLELLAFCGIPLESVVEMERQAEEREEPGRIQEERDPGDPVA